MRKRLTAVERRALIVEAAGRAFGERGFDGARLDEIAAAAGVTKPVLYRHFAGKRALYLALLERHRADLSSFAVPADGETGDRMRAVLEVWLDYVEAHSYSWKMLFRDSGGGPEVAAYRAEVHARARAVIVEMIGAVSDGAIPPREREPLAEMIRMGMASLVLLRLDNPEIRRRDVLDAMTRVWAGMLAAL